MKRARKGSGGADASRELQRTLQAAARRLGRALEGRGALVTPTPADSRKVSLALVELVGELVELVGPRDQGELQDLFETARRVWDAHLEGPAAEAALLAELPGQLGAGPGGSRGVDWRAAIQRLQERRRQPPFLADRRWILTVTLRPGKVPGDVDVNATWDPARSRGAPAAG